MRGESRRVYEIVVGACLVALGLVVPFGDSAKGVCDDSMWDNVTDTDGNGCYHYTLFPSECGRKDDLNFTASKMCCA